MEEKEAMFNAKQQLSGQEFREKQRQDKMAKKNRQRQEDLARLAQEGGA